MNEFNVQLDLAKGRARQQQTVFVRQGDKNATTIVATITDHGAAASTSGMTARFSMRLPNGTEYYRKAASLSGNTTTVTIDEAQAASVAGRTDVAYFQLLQGSTVVASTESFTVVVLPDALADATVPESYDSAIQDAIDALDGAVADMPDMVEDVLEAHPEWTTTVQDGSIGKDKLATDLARDRERLLYRLDNLLTAQLPEGETATATDAAKTPMAGLALYGRSTQAGTPTPSAPVPIVSVAPDSQGNISLLARRTSNASVQTVTPIDLDGHELRSLPDGTRDELTVDQYGHAVLVQRVGSRTTHTVSGATVNSDGTVKFVAIGQAALGGESALCNIAVQDSPDNTNKMAFGPSGSLFLRLPSALVGTTNSAIKAWLDEHGVEILYPLATPVTHDLGYVAAVPLCGPDLTAQAVPTAPFALTYERDLDATLVRLESAIATLA